MKRLLTIVFSWLTYFRYRERNNLRGLDQLPIFRSNWYIYFRAAGFSYIYPQFLEKYALPNDRANEALVESGLKQLSRHLEMLEKKYLDKSQFLIGNRITVADSYIASVLLQTQWAGMKFSMWPKVEKWLKRVSNQVHWDIVHSSHNMYVKELERCALFDWKLSASVEFSLSCVQVLRPSRPTAQQCCR